MADPGSGTTAADTVQTLLIDVRANTQGFAQDIAGMRSTFDGTLVDGFGQAGGVLETGLLAAIAKGNAGFLDLRTTALGVINDVAAQATANLFGAIGADSGSGRGGLLGIGSVIGSVLGLPGRATGGPVSPGQPYLVGEQGPEVFVPTSAGAIASGGDGGARNVNVAITITNPAGGNSSAALERSGRQVASAVRRALTQS